MGVYRHRCLGRTLWASTVACLANQSMEHACRSVTEPFPPNTAPPSGRTRSAPITFSQAKARLLYSSTHIHSNTQTQANLCETYFFCFFDDVPKRQICAPKIYSLLFRSLCTSIIKPNKQPLMCVNQRAQQDAKPGTPGKIWVRKHEYDTL